MANEFVDVQITLGTTAVSRAGFGVPLVFSKTALFNDVRTYTDMDGVAEDFSSTEETYKLANALFGQDLKPEGIKVAKWDTGNTIEDELNALKVKNNDWYFLILDSPSDQNVEDAAAWTETQVKLFAFLSTDPATKAATTTDLMATIEALGYDRTMGYYTEAPVSQVQTITFDIDFVSLNVINGKIGTDAISPVTFATDQATTIGLLATEIQSNTNVLTATVTDTKEITVTTVANTSIVLSSFLVTLGATQAVATIAETVAVTVGTAGNRNHAAAVGKMAPRSPGSATWKFKELAGIVADDSYTDTEQVNLLSKNAMIYTTVGGVSVTQEGQVASGEFIDVIRGTDLIQARIEEDVYSALVNTDKIPYTDLGLSIIEGKVQSVLENDGVAGGILSPDPAPTTTVPAVANVSANDKATRLVQNITFTGTLAGAVHKTIIRGTITV